MYEGHQGIKNVSCKSGTAGMNMDTEQSVEVCETCHHPQQTCQVLQQTPTPKHPWQALSTDQFHIDGHEWHIVSDFDERC